MNGAKLLGAGKKNGKKSWIETAAIFLLHESKRFLMAVACLVAALTAQCVVNIGDGYQARRQWRVSSFWPRKRVVTGSYSCARWWRIFCVVTAAEPTVFFLLFESLALAGLSLA